MWIVYWTTKVTTGHGDITKDEYLILEEEDEADEMYEAIITKDNIFTAGYAPVKKSTDAPHIKEGLLMVLGEKPKGLVGLNNAAFEVFISDRDLKKGDVLEWRTFQVIVYSTQFISKYYLVKLLTDNANAFLPVEAFGHSDWVKR